MGAVPPVAVAVKLAAVPTVVVIAETGLIDSCCCPLTGLTVMVTGMFTWAGVVAESVAVTLNEYVPAVVGVNENAPVAELIVAPDGTVPVNE
jgi:hypothetical protein